MGPRTIRVLGHVQHDLRQEQGSQHDVEQQLAAGEVETAKAVAFGEILQPEWKEYEFIKKKS